MSHVTFSEVTSVWGVSVVAILDCSLNVYACGRQKALAMPAYCVAANCNNSQATQNVTMHEFPLWGENGSNLCISNELTSMLRLITPICVASTSLSVISQTLLNTAYQSGFWSQQHFLLCKKHQSRLQNTWKTKRLINEYAKRTFNNNTKEMKGPSI